MTDKDKIENFLSAKGFKRDPERRDQFVKDGLGIDETMLDMSFQKFLNIYTKEKPNENRASYI